MNRKSPTLQTDRRRTTYDSNTARFALRAPRGKNEMIWEIKTYATT